MTSVWWFLRSIPDNASKIYKWQVRKNKRRQTQKLLLLRIKLSKPVITCGDRRRAIASWSTYESETIDRDCRWRTTARGGYKWAAAQGHHILGGPTNVKWPWIFIIRCFRAQNPSWLFHQITRFEYLWSKNSLALE